MCQAYTAATLGLLEPLILLLPALMLRESMRRGAKASALFRAGELGRSVLPRTQRRVARCQASCGALRAQGRPSPAASSARHSSSPRP